MIGSESRQVESDATRVPPEAKLGKLFPADP